MATFTLPFDYTFRPRLLDDGQPPVQTGCRLEGVYLTWLTVQGGWMYWLFEGDYKEGQSTISRGQAMQGGLLRHTQKETASTLLLYTANLTRAEADAVGTLRESVSAYWLVHLADNSILQVPVMVPVGEAQLWDTHNHTNDFSIVVTLPSRRSQRI